MHILLIDNGTIRLTKLKSLLHGNKVKTVKFDKIGLVDIKNFDLIILSGSSQFPIFDNEDLYKNEINLIKNSNKSIVGICLGFELIGYTYGAKLLKLEGKERGITDIQITKPNGIFNKLPNFSVYESHRWIIKDLPNDLVELARSNNGIEAIKHKNRKLYGFQFHPEMFVDKACGDEIFNNLLQLLNK